MTTTPRQFAALDDVIMTLGAMADGVCPPHVHLSSLDPGTGKTTALIQFLKRVVVSEDHGMVGVLVCLSRLDEITRLVDAAGLNEEDFAVLCSDDAVTSLSSTLIDRAQVLFTTQAMVRSRMTGQAFATSRDVFYLNRPRQVRIWDEAIEPGEVITMSTHELASLLEGLQRISPTLASQVQDLQFDLATAAKNTVLQMSPLPELAKLGPTSAQVESAFHQRLEKLRALAGHKVRVIDSRGDLVIALNTRDALPHDLAPLLVLDASGRIRTTYDLWQDREDPLVRLRSAPKSYGPLELHLMDRGGGKDSWSKSGDILAQEVASVVDSKPDEPWLIVHHKEANGIDPKRLIKKQIKTNLSRVQFLTWGAHQATNAFKDVPNVVLAGLMHLPEAHLMGLAYASSGRSVEDELPSGLVQQIERGELGHAIVQAIGRGTVRATRDGACGAASAYIIAAPKYRLQNQLGTWFPGASVAPWRPKHKPLQGQIAKAISFLTQRHAGQPGQPVWFVDVMAALGITDKANFNRTIRKNETFRQALEAVGMREFQLVSKRGMDAFGSLLGPLPSVQHSPQDFVAKI